MSLNKLICNKDFRIFLFGQGVLCIGNSFGFIALTTMLVKLTGSGLNSIVGMMVSQIPSLVLAPIAGYMGDRFNIKYFSFGVDLLRSLVILLFIGNNNINIVYGIMFILSTIDSFASPVKRKLLACVIDEKDIMSANSLISGVGGIVFIFCPVIAGLIINRMGTDIIFYIYSLLFVASAVSFTLIRTKVSKSSTKRSFSGGIKDAYNYFSNSPSIKDTIIISAVLCAATTAIGTAFYPFAFDTMKVSEQNWGVIISVYNGTNLIATMISIYFNKKLNRRMDLYIIISIFVTSVLWMFYCVFNDFKSVLLIQFMEGTVLGLCGILLSTKIFSATKKIYMARVLSFGDIINNTLRIAVTAITYILLRYFSEKYIFMLGSTVLLIFVFVYCFSRISCRLLAKNRIR